MSFKGILVEAPTGGRTYVNPLGFRGISIEIPDNIRYLKIVDFRGNPYPQARVTVHNTGGDIVSFSNQNGIAEIEVDTVGTVQIDVEQYRAISPPVTYTYASEFPTKTVLLDGGTSHL